MGFLMSVGLPFLAAAAVAIACTIAWRDQLVKPVLFGAVAFVLVIGVHHLVASVVALVKNLWPIGEGYFLAVRPTSAADVMAIERQMTLEALAIVVVAAVLSYPLLSLIKAGFEK